MTATVTAPAATLESLLIGYTKEVKSLIRQDWQQAKAADQLESEYVESLMNYEGGVRGYLAQYYPEFTGEIRAKTVGERLSDVQAENGRLKALARQTAASAARQASLASGLSSLKGVSGIARKADSIAIQTAKQMTALHRIDEQADNGLRKLASGKGFDTLEPKEDKGKARFTMNGDEIAKADGRAVFSLLGGVKGDESCDAAVATQIVARLKLKAEIGETAYRLVKETEKKDYEKSIRVTFYEKETGGIGFRVFNVNLNKSGDDKWTMPLTDSEAVIA